MFEAKSGHVRLLLALFTMAVSSAYATNNPPQISGTPPAEVEIGTLYSFQPMAFDKEGTKLKYSIAAKPGWATFSTATGKLAGTPQLADVGAHPNIKISVSDGRSTVSLPLFSVTVTDPRKANYGHYFATRYGDTPADAAMLCEQAGVRGVIWRKTWGEVEPSAGNYDFSGFDAVLAAIAGSHNPQCQLWLFVEYKSFTSSPVKNPCPTYLQAQYSALNADGNGASTCFMWQPDVVKAYGAMIEAAAARYDANPRIEGMIFQESALGFNGAYSQDVAVGGTYTPEAWRDGLIQMITKCGAAFTRSRCVSFLNFLRGNQSYLYAVSDAISAVPRNRACISGPDVLPNDPTLYVDSASIYQVIVRHTGCRSNSAQFSSYDVAGCGLDCIFRFGVGGTFGSFPTATPTAGGLCINSYFFWSHRVSPSSTGLTWLDALPVIDAYPYGTAWLDQCVGGGGVP